MGANIVGAKVYGAKVVGANTGSKVSGAKVLDTREIQGGCEEPDGIQEKIEACGVEPPK